VRLKKNKANNGYTLSLANLPTPPPDRQEEELEDLETPCGTPIEAETQVVVMSTRKAMTIDCQSYNFPRLGLAVATSRSATGQDPTGDSASPHEAAVAHESNQDGGTGTAAGKTNACSVDIPLNRVDETYTLTVFAHDACFKDYLQNPKALIDHVEVKVTPVTTPASGTRTRSQSTTSRQQNARLSGKTVDGFTELSGLIPNQPYLIEYVGPKDYICVTPPPTQFQNLCGGDTILRAFFKPCSKTPSRTIVFVQEACPGMRVAKLMVQAGSQSGCTDEHGILNLLPGTTGSIEFQASGKMFSPRSIDLTNDSPMVYIVGVADQQVEQQVPRRERFRFVDGRGQGFAHRQLRLVSPSGHEKMARTDHEGWFEGEEGWTAHADDDEVGFSAEFPLLTTEVR
jgi:hypothetical protein